MPAGDEGEALVRAVEALSGELGCELAVAELRRALAELAAAVARGPRLGDEPPGGVIGALDGIELVMRGGFLRGKAEDLRPLLPGFVFLVVLPVAGDDRALALARLAEALLTEAA